MPAPHPTQALPAAFLLALVACGDPAMMDTLLPERSFTVSTTAMEPALPFNSQVQSVLVEPAQLKRGDIVLVRAANGDIYISRLIGLPGDTVELRQGQVILANVPATQVARGPYTLFMREGLPAREVQRLRETLPGTAAGHDILDERETAGDEFGPVTLGPDQWFVLGDNRDYAADSRFGPEVNGLGLIKAAQIERRVSSAPTVP